MTEEKLMTLKDIDDNLNVAWKSKLREEAIKWYKSNIDKPPKDRISGSDWLEFFNITDEDLK